MIKKIAIVIPVHNRKEITLKCLQKLEKTQKKGLKTDIVVIDDGSIDGTSKAILDLYPKVTVLKGDGNLWWSGATNLGVKHALQNNADYILTLNDDVDFENDFLKVMVSTAMLHPKNIICGLICYEKNRDVILSAGRYRAGFLGYKLPARDRNKKRSGLKERYIKSELESGYAMLIPTAVFNTIGFFNSKKFPHHMGDMDFVLRARKVGYEVLVDTKVIFYTTPGKNYLLNFFVEKSLRENLMALVNVRSTSFWRTRFNFIFKHTQPVELAPASMIYFVARMSTLFFIKALFPRSIIIKMAYKRYGKETYDNQ